MPTDSAELASAAAAELRAAGFSDERIGQLAAEFVASHPTGSVGAFLAWAYSERAHRHAGGRGDASDESTAPPGSGSR
jgi:hypothetical protein